MNGPSTLRALTVMALALCCVAGPASAQSRPEFINFQGRSKAALSLLPSRLDQFSCSSRCGHTWGTPRSPLPILNAAAAREVRAARATGSHGRAPERPGGNCRREN